MPIQLVVAVSDKGRIQRLDDWKEPDEPFRVFVTKADLVPDKIAGELERHRKGPSLLSIKPTGEYGAWSMEAQEAAGVAEFLAARHVDRSGGAPAPSSRAATGRSRKSARDKSTRAKDTTEAACRHCGAKDLTAHYRYGYYWRCGACGKTTPMPPACPACGAKGHRGKGVRIRKDGADYFSDCEGCGASERIWTAE